MFKILSNKKYKQLKDIIKKQKMAFNCELIRNRHLEQKLKECNADLRVIESRNKDLNKQYDKTELNLRETELNLRRLTININTLISIINKYSQFNKLYLLELLENLKYGCFDDLIANIDKSQSKVMRYSSKKTLNYKEDFKHD